MVCWTPTHSISNLLSMVLWTSYTCYIVPLPMIFWLRYTWNIENPFMVLWIPVLVEMRGFNFIMMEFNIQWRKLESGKNHFVSFRLVWFCVVSFRSVSFRFVWFRFVRFRFASFRFYFVSHFTGTHIKSLPKMTTPHRGHKFPFSDIKLNVTKKNEKFNMAWRLRGFIIYWLSKFRRV
jgi:hypothetical protein